jgi:histidinol-phosphate aminotransferase
MLAHCDASTGLVYICNPNNPTGTLTLRRDLEEFVRKLPPGIPVLVDEAYHHYVIPFPAYSSFIDNPVDDNRVIVVRTFSKIYALAGLRIGYGVATPEMARRLLQFRLQFAANSLAIPAAMAALDDTEQVSRCAQRNAGARQEFDNQSNLRMLGVSDSQANFVLLELDHPINEVIEHFRKNNVLVGPRFPGVDSFLRVSMGRPEEMKEFWRVWDLLPHNMEH